MNRLIITLLFSLFGSFTCGAHAQHSEPAMYQCDPLHSRLRVDLVAKQPQRLPPLQGSQAPVQLQFPEFALLDREEREKEGLSPLRGPSEIVQMTCGKLQIHLRSEALNGNPDGELGAVTFGSIEVLVAGRQLLDSTRLAVCETGFPRWSPCPDHYATSILLGFNARKASARATIVRRFVDESGKETRRQDELTDLRPKPRSR